jgi:hypothetical protein
MEAANGEPTLKDALPRNRRVRFGTMAGINGYPAEQSRSENVNERRLSS